MSRLIFAALLGVIFTGSGGAQEVPGRDLLLFPLGALASARPLSHPSVGGLWNPAVAILPSDVRTVAAFAVLTTPVDQAVDGRMGSVSRLVAKQWTTTLSVASIDVGDILRTDTDPQPIGSEIPFRTSVVSVGGARSWGGTGTRPKIAVGGALRYHWGTVDTETRGTVTTDFGVVADKFPGTPVRVAASTFLLSPSGDKDKPTLMVAADLPAVLLDSTLAASVGYAWSMTSGRATERFYSASAAYSVLEGQIGIARTTEFGRTTSALRIGVGLQYARYHIGIAREDGAAGIGASYHFMLSSAFR